RLSDDPVQRGTRAAVDRRVLLLRTSRLPQGARDVDLRGGESVVTRHLTIHDARVCRVPAGSVRGTLEPSTEVARGAERPAVLPLPDLVPLSEQVQPAERHLPHAANLGQRGSLVCAHVSLLSSSQRPCTASPPGRAPRRCKADRKSTRLNSSHVSISYAVFCLKKKKGR